MLTRGSAWDRAARLCAAWGLPWSPGPIAPHICHRLAATCRNHTWHGSCRRAATPKAVSDTVGHGGAVPRTPPVGHPHQAALPRAHLSTPPANREGSPADLLVTQLCLEVVHNAANTIFQARYDSPSFLRTVSVSFLEPDLRGPRETPGRWYLFSVTWGCF